MLNIWVKVAIVFEATLIGLVYSAENGNPATSNTSTELSYFAHIVGMVWSIAMVTPFNDEFKPILLEDEDEEMVMIEFTDVSSL